MKKVLSTIIGALAAVSFAAIVSAADMPANTGTTSAPAATSNGDQGSKPVTKHKKSSKRHHKKAHKKAMKKEAAPASAPATTAPSNPAPAGK